MGRPDFGLLPDRMPAISADDYTPEQRAAAERLISTPRGNVRGPFIPLLRSPELLDRAQALGEFLRYHCSVPVRLREFAILVTARHWSQPYEWLAHIRPAITAGVNRRVLEQIAQGEEPLAANADELTIHAFVMQVHTGGRVDDTTYAAARLLLGEQGVIELLGICGYYAMLAMILNVARTACSDPSFPVPPTE